MQKMILEMLTAHGRLAKANLHLLKTTPQLLALNALPEEELLKLVNEILTMLAHWFDKAADKNSIGAFAVGMGKTLCKQSVPVSEIVYALMIMRKQVAELVEEESIFDNPGLIYATIDDVSKISDYYFLLSYYTTKGYLEETFVAMRSENALSEDTLKHFFKDDFFFKQ
jgi:hypothetical protein